MRSHISEDNPLGLISIDHLEFTTNDLEGESKKLFYTLGFSKTATNSKLGQELFTQGQVRFLLVHSPDSDSHSQKYFKNHGEGVSKMSFLVENCEHAIKTALDRGAELVQDLNVEEFNGMTFKTAQIKGFGDVLNEFVERPNHIFRPGFINCEDQSARPLKQRVARIDHLTNNVPKGEMEKWVEFYQKIYGFKVTRYFDIKGVKTGLESKVVQLANGNIIIPINEPDSEESKSQINEFLERHNGAGVQHIALTTAHIQDTVGDLIERGIKFLKIPHAYYQDIPNRNFDCNEDLELLEKRQLLVDGDEKGYLIQNFTDTYIGPLFFEYIQRKGHDGFGEGNFQALFDAIERDQQDRGYL